MWSKGSNLCNSIRPSYVPFRTSWERKQFNYRRVYDSEPLLAQTWYGLFIDMCSRMNLISQELPYVQTGEFPLCSIRLLLALSLVTFWKFLPSTTEVHNPPCTQTQPNSVPHTWLSWVLFRACGLFIWGRRWVAALWRGLGQGYKTLKRFTPFFFSAYVLILTVSTETTPHVEICHGRPASFFSSTCRESETS